MKIYIQNIVIIAGIIVAITASCQWGQTQNFSRIKILDMKVKDEAQIFGASEHSGMIALIKEFNVWKTK